MHSSPPVVCLWSLNIGFLPVDGMALVHYVNHNFILLVTPLDCLFVFRYSFLQGSAHLSHIYSFTSIAFDLVYNAFLLLRGGGSCSSLGPAFVSWFWGGRSLASASLALWLCTLFRSFLKALSHKVDTGFAYVSFLLPLHHFHNSADINNFDFYIHLTVITCRRMRAITTNFY